MGATDRIQALQDAVTLDGCAGKQNAERPLVATYRVQRMVDDFAPVYYLMIVAVLQFAAIQPDVRDRRRQLDVAHALAPDAGDGAKNSAVTA